jgi:hypothetical protein
MNWLLRWRAISARMLGVIEATNFLLRAYNVQNQNTGEVGRLLQEVHQVKTELSKLYQDYRMQMPPLAAEALKAYCDVPVPSSSASGDATELQLLAGLQVFRAKFEYLIQDREIEGRSATELAFHHLRRLIAVDQEVGRKWQNAYNDGETACEKLGAVHLLAHGIWAFKVKGGHAETDLVFGEKVDAGAAEISRAARAIVLTEWKIVRDPRDIEEKAGEARRQADEYEAGVLGDLELKGTRYIIILVGQNQNPGLDDVQNKGIRYRHIWIAVEPKSPSKAARRTT